MLDNCRRCAAPLARRVLYRLAMLTKHSLPFRFGIFALACCSILAAGGPPARGHRSAAAKYAFRRAHPCPATGLTRGACPGYVVDHIKALKRGGPDTPANMQWQTREAAKAKDRLE